MLQIFHSFAITLLYEKHNNLINLLKEWKQKEFTPSETDMPKEKQT